MNPDPKLEKLLDAELKKLPPLSAPPSLMRHVLARLEARATLPWWQRAWWDWPRAAQAAFIGVALGVATLFTTGGAWANDQAADWFQQLGDRAGSFAA